MKQKNYFVVVVVVVVVNKGEALNFPNVFVDLSIVE